MLTSVLGSAIFSLAVRNCHAAGWVYAYDGATEADSAAQEATWTDAACQIGREQSPINVDTTKVVTAQTLPGVDTFFTASPSYVKNTGHGFQLFETSPDTHSLNSTSGSHEVDELGSPKGYSVFGDQKYNFYQVHWHSPSENTVDGKSFPLEAHFVHQLDDPALVGTLNQLAVIGLLYDWGECNEFLDNFWGQFPEQAGSLPFTPGSGTEVDLNAHLVSELKEGYYHWWGSLTTPPCTEGVNWNLLKKPQTVCQRQVDEITTALANTQNGISFNNRVVQPLYDRVVTATGTVSSQQVVVVKDEESGVALAALVVASITLFLLLVGFIAIAYLLVQQGTNGQPAPRKEEDLTV